MTELNDLLKKWNNGISRGTQAKLAEELNVSEPTVATWLSGKISPSEINLKKMAKLFKISEKDLQKKFSSIKKYSSMIKGSNNVANVGDGLTDVHKELELIKKDIEILKLKLDGLQK